MAVELVGSGKRLIKLKKHNGDDQGRFLCSHGAASNKGAQMAAFFTALVTDAATNAPHSAGRYCGERDKSSSWALVHNDNNEDSLWSLEPRGGNKYLLRKAKNHDSGRKLAQHQEYCMDAEHFGGQRDAESFWVFVHDDDHEWEFECVDKENQLYHIKSQGTYLQAPTNPLQEDMRPLSVMQWPDRDGKRDGLSSWAMCSKSKKGTWQVLPGIEPTQIDRIEFMEDQAKVIKRPDVVQELYSSNDCKQLNVPTTDTLKFAHEVGLEHSFEHTHGFAVTVGAEFECGLPLVEKSGLKVEISTEHTFTWGTTKKKTTNNAVDKSVTLNPGQHVKATMIVSISDFEIPFKIHWVDKDGYSFPPSDGIWKGQTCMNVHTRVQDMDDNGNVVE